MQSSSSQKTTSYPAAKQVVKLKKESPGLIVSRKQLMLGSPNWHQRQNLNLKQWKRFWLKRMRRVWVLLWLLKCYKEYGHQLQWGSDSPKSWPSLLLVIYYPNDKVRWWTVWRWGSHIWVCFYQCSRCWREVIYLINLYMINDAFVKAVYLVVNDQKVYAWGSVAMWLVISMSLLL